MQKPKYCSYCGSNQEPYLTAEEAAEMISCSVETIRDWIQNRKIGSTKINGLRRLTRCEIEKIAIHFPSVNGIAAALPAE